MEVKEETQEERKKREKKEYQKEYYETNRKEINKKMKEYYEANKEKLLENQKKYAEANKEKVAKNGKEWYESNKEKKAKYNKEYRAANKEELNKKKREKYVANKDKRKKYYAANKDKSTENLKKLIGELKGEHVMEWESIDQCVEILEKIKDTEDDEEVKVIKKVVIFIKKTYDSGRETYILPEELEYLNDLYLPEEDVPEDVVVLTEEEVELDISEDLALVLSIIQQTPEQLAKKFEDSDRYKNKIKAITTAKKKKDENFKKNSKKTSDDIKKSNKQIAKLEKELLQLKLLLILPAKEKKVRSVVAED